VASLGKDSADSVLSKKFIAAQSQLLAVLSPRTAPLLELGKNVCRSLRVFQRFTNSRGERGEECGNETREDFSSDIDAGGDTDVTACEEVREDDNMGILQELNGIYASIPPVDFRNEPGWRRLSDYANEDETHIIRDCTEYLTDTRCGDPDEECTFPAKAGQNQAGRISIVGEGTNFYSKLEEVHQQIERLTEILTQDTEEVSEESRAMHLQVLDGMSNWISKVGVARALIADDGLRKLLGKRMNVEYGPSYLRKKDFDMMIPYSAAKTPKEVSTTDISMFKSDVSRSGR